MFIRGGLGLGSTIAIFASISSDVIAMEAVKAKNSIHDFRSELNQIAWDRACSFKEYAFQYLCKQKEYSWILDDKYKDSRTKVIGKAIGDCVAREGAFANKAPEEIITFKDTDPKTYKQRNWNAVILYNYIHEAINGEAFKEFFTAGCGAIKAKENKENYIKQLSGVRGVLKNKLEKLKEHYKAECGEKYIKRLDKAVEHIQKYVSTLGLAGCLYNFGLSKVKYDGRRDKRLRGDLAPDSHQPSYGRDNLLVLGFFSVSPGDGPNKRLGFVPQFRHYEHNLYLSELMIKPQSREKGKGNSYVWKSEDFHFVDTIDELRNGKGKWLIDRLAGLAEVPSEELWNKWQKEED